MVDPPIIMDIPRTDDERERAGAENVVVRPVVRQTARVYSTVGIPDHPLGNRAQRRALKKQGLLKEGWG